MNRRPLAIARFASWAACAAGALLLFVGYFSARAAFFQAWWMAWIFWGGISFGAFAVLCLQALTGGRWSALLRRPVEAAAQTLPVAALLMLPAAAGFSSIFPWAQPDFFSTHHLPHHQRYLTEGGFWFRALLYFVPTIPLAFLVRMYTRAAELRPAGSNRGLLAGLGGIGAVVYVLTMNFASTDWVMSLEPEWSSTIFAIIFMAGQFLSALALCAVVALLFAPPETLAPALLRDVGNLLLAFVIFWAYVTFSQFLIIWSGNLPHEISWYVHRRQAGWPAAVLWLGIAQFLLPFALLLSRASKHRPRVLAAIAGFIFAANMLHTYWLIAPTYHPQTAAPRWLDFAALLAIGGLWMATYLRSLEATYVRTF
jgi:hypothetical protein